MGERSDHEQRRVSNRPLYLAHVSAVQLRIKAQPFLRESMISPKCLEVDRQMFSQRLVVAFLHGLKADCIEIAGPRDIIYKPKSSELKMLLTQAQWAESNPAKRKLSEPNRPWRCVGLSGESPIFFVDLFWDGEGNDQAIRSVLVSTPEDLIEVVTDFGRDRCRVFHFELANGDRDALPVLTEVIAIRSYREPGTLVKGYVYVDIQGHQQACFSWLPAPGENSEWKDELRFNDYTS